MRCPTQRRVQITVDGDTSTNDTVLALASGAAGNAEISDGGSEAAQRLEAAMTAVLQGLAKAIAWDGEGATCLLEVTCVGAASADDALTVAKSVAASSLTKAAIFGHDPNWGRIACAAGYSGALLRPHDRPCVRRVQHNSLQQLAAKHTTRRIGTGISIASIHPQHASTLEQHTTDTESAGAVCRGGVQPGRPRGEARAVCADGEGPAARL